MGKTILVGEEPTLGTSQSKVLMILIPLDLIQLREIGRPCGVGKALIEFKLLCGWRLMSGYLLIIVGANGGLEFHPYVLLVTKTMKQLSMFCEIVP
jgi:hypothetical protein